MPLPPSHPTYTSTALPPYPCPFPAPEPHHPSTPPPLHPNPVCIGFGLLWADIYHPPPTPHPTRPTPPAGRSGRGAGRRAAGRRRPPPAQCPGAPVPAGRMLRGGAEAGRPPAGARRREGEGVWGAGWDACRCRCFGNCHSGLLTVVADRVHHRHRLARHAWNPPSHPHTHTHTLRNSNCLPRHSTHLPPHTRAQALALPDPRVLVLEPPPALSAALAAPPGNLAAEVGAGSAGAGAAAAASGTESMSM